jgi:acetolactate synthase-1/2/3 large subunit
VDGGSIIASVLRQKGVKHLFTLCGGHISPILVGARKNGIGVIDVRNEATAVFAADAAARLTGSPGVAAVTAGPGVTNTITAMQNARMAQSPLVLLGGAAATVLKGRGSLQDIDQQSLMAPVAKSMLRVDQNCDIASTLEVAFDLATSGIPGPVFMECPIDLLYDESIVRKWYLGATGSKTAAGFKKKLQQMYLKHHVDRMFACDIDSVTANDTNEPPETVNRRSVIQAAETIAIAERPVLVLGSQVVADPKQAIGLAHAVNALGIPVYLAGMARGLMGADHPLHLRHHRRDALGAADVVILAGMPCDFRLNYGRSIGSGARLISINRSHQDLKLNRRPDIGILGSPTEFLRALAEALPPSSRTWAEWLRARQAADHERNREIQASAEQPTAAVNPLALLMELDAQLPENSLLVADGGDFIGSAAYILKPRRPLSWLDPGVFGTLGVGAGFAMGAAVSRPDAEVWLLYGDGAAGYSLMEMDSLVRHGIPVIALVGNDGGWAQIARDQVSILEDDVGTVLRQSDYHSVAEGLGARGLLLEKTADVGDVLREARKIAADGRPVLINARIDRTDFRDGSISM